MYLKYFGLRESPFSLTPNSKFFYDSAFHREALASLIYGINAKKGFVVVTGEVGTGKTTLIRKLLRGLEATHHSVFIFNTLVTFDELLENIMQDLGLDHTGLNRGAIIRRLNDFLLDKASKGQTVSLLIDEAQNLGDDALEGVRLLSNFETDREKLIQIILIGQPELEVKLNSPALRQLKQRVSLWSRLDRLSSTETESYIRHRLKIAGYQGPDIFTAVAIKSICYHASGTPRLINSICDNALLTAFAISKKIVSEQIVEEVVQDLQLKRDDQNLGFGRSDEGGREQAPSRAARQVSEIAGGKLMPSADAGEPWSGMRVRSTPQESQSAYSFGLKQVAASEARGSEQRPSRARSNVAELKDKRARNRGRTDSEAGAEIIGSRKLQYGDASARTGGSVSAAFFVEMTEALTEAMGPMAALVVKDQIARIGESVQNFPASQLPHLVSSIKREILSDHLRRRFEDEMAKQIQKHSQSLT